MAKQAEGLQLQGTIGWITFYCLNGKYYARRRSKLKRKTVKYSPRFEKTRQYANWLGKASAITSAVYRSLPKERQVYTFYCELKSLAYAWLKEGASEEEVKRRLEVKVKPKKGKRIGLVRKVKEQKVSALSNLFVLLPKMGRMERGKKQIRKELLKRSYDSS